MRLRASVGLIEGWKTEIRDASDQIEILKRTAQG
jgi:hypothetical protein